MALKAIGILDVIPNIFKTAQDKIFNLSGNGLSIIAFAFLIYAFLESKALQSFFASSKQEKWKKRRNRVIVILTVAASIMSTFLFWYDEYIHFFPLIIPLFLSMGLDGFSSFFCLFGGAAAGLMAAVSPVNLTSYFNHVNEYTDDKTAFKGADGIGFRLVSWLIFTTIIVFFNIWYCNKIYLQSSSQKKKETVKALPNKFVAKKPLSKKIKWIIISVFGFFVLGSILGSIPWFAKNLPGKEGTIQEKAPYLSSSYKAGLSKRGESTGETYKKIGTMDKEITTGEEEEKGKQQDIAKVETNVNESFWPKFGHWDELQLCSWFVVGAIIICLLSKQNVANTLITTAQKTIPILIGYILMSTAATIIKESGMQNRLKDYLLSEKITKHASIFALFSIFFSFFLVSLVAHSLAFPLFLSVVPALFAISPQVVLYATIIMLMARFLAVSISPTNVILMNALEASGTTYKEYIKKTWVLWLIIFLVALGLVGFCAFHFR
ncbi:MAG: hypothetical protein MRECE_24c018 [Mycoplasmataceae bacterium CE_OT135]|nr:MAG: hypothetical protein MRECE_24c018 [Mycoplasmataceae bacterium CE_OT135]